MKSWPGPRVPRLPGRGRPLRLHDTRDRGGPPDRARCHRPDVRLRHHAVRRHPHGPRRDLRRLRPAQPGLARRRPRGRATCRTSPTSTTRCSSGPSATASDWGELAERETELFREDMAALRVLPPDHYVGAVEAIPLIVDAGPSGCRTSGAAYDVDDDLYFSVRRRARLRRGVRAGRGQRCCAIFAERGGDPDRPGKKDPLDCAALAGRAARRAGLGLAARAAAAPAGTSSAPRSRSTTSARPSTSRAAAATWSSRTTRCAPSRGRRWRPGRGRSPGPTCTPGWSASTARRCRSPRATWCSCPGCASPAPTRWRSGWRCWPTTTARLGVEPAHAGPRQVARLDALAVRRSRWRPARTAGPVLDRVRERLADDLDTPAALRAVDRWADEALTRGGPPPRRRGWSARLVDALLGVAL